MIHRTEGFNLAEKNMAWEFDTTDQDDFYVHPELVLPATTTAVLTLERKHGETWGDPSAGATTLTIGAFSQSFPVEADRYRVRVSTAGAAGDVARLTATTKRTH